MPINVHFKTPGGTVSAWQSKTKRKAEEGHLVGAGREVQSGSNVGKWKE